jgi:hypothetical protein
MASASILNTSNQIYAFTGSNWIPLNAQNNLSQITRWQYSTVGGETTLSGLDDNQLSLSYSPGYEYVYLNGILLVRGDDYTATNGTSITGLSPLNADNIIEILSFKSITIADVYTQSQSDNKYLTQIAASAAYLTQSSASNLYEKNISYSSSTPAAPVAGTLWVDDTDPLAPVLKVYNGSEWITMSGAGGGGLKTHFLLMGA